MKRAVLLALLAAGCASRRAATGPSLPEGPRPGTYAVLVTDRGPLAVRLFPNDAARTVEHFKSLVEGGSLQGVEFHRSIPGFLLQAAVKTSTAAIPLESTPGRGFAKPGRVAMAVEDGASDASQFFITLSPAPWLDGKHAVFGEVTEGLELLEAASREPRTERDGSGVLIDRPHKPVRIESARLEERK